MTRDGGGTLAGARLAEREGEKTTLSAVADPCEGAGGDRDEEWWRRYTRRWALARSTTSEPPSLARPSFIPETPPPAMSARIPAKQMPPQARGNGRAQEGANTARRHGPNQVDEPHLCPLEDIRDKLLTSQKYQQKRLDRYLPLHFLLVFRRNNCRESCCGFGDCA